LVLGLVVVGEVPTFDDWAAGEFPSADKMTTNVRDAGNFWRAPPLCVLRRDTDLSIGTSTFVAVTWQTVDVDNDGMFDAGTPTRITAQTPGWYQLTGAVAFAASAAGLRTAQYKRNGVDLFRCINALAVGASFFTELPFTGVVRLEADDYVEAIVWHNVGSALNLTAVDKTPRLELKWISA
jgi:hypothetical protein